MLNQKLSKQRQELFALKFHIYLNKLYLTLAIETVRVAQGVFCFVNHNLGLMHHISL